MDQLYGGTRFIQLKSGPLKNFLITERMEIRETFTKLNFFTI